VRLSPHFNLDEFGAVPPKVVPAYRSLCEEVLEPIRERFGLPMVITSGYRSPEHNASVGGTLYSQHQATPFYCAADFKVPGLALMEVFDWVRLESRLPFDQIIIEHADRLGPPVVIHISWVRPARRAAWQGLTGGRSSYVRYETNP